MKRILIFKKNILLFIFCLLSLPIFAQVGINTTTPRTTLEVAGNTIIDGTINVNNIDVVQNEDVSYLLTQNQGNMIKELNTTQVGNALAYFQEYVLTNVNGDWVRNFNTNVQASKYSMIVISAYFSRELVMNGTPENFAIPAVSAFVDGLTPTWRLRADYPSAGTKGEINGTWTIKTLIITRNITKGIPMDMDGGTTQQAEAPIID